HWIFERLGHLFKLNRICPEKTAQKLVRSMCQQFLSGFEELRVILDLPQIPIHRNPLRFECSGEGIHHTREVLLRASIADDEVRILCEKAEVCQRINLGHGVPVVIQHRLGEDVVNLETAKLAE